MIDRIAFGIKGFSNDIHVGRLRNSRLYPLLKRVEGDANSSTARILAKRAMLKAGLH